MVYDSSIYYGCIVKGDLHGAMSYVRQFPERSALYERFMNRFAHERRITYEADAELERILTAYQQYYRDVFYLRMDRKQAENRLRDRLAQALGIHEDGTELCDIEQNQLVEMFRSHGLHFLGGKSSGYYGPYVWRTTETVSYDVELPDGVQTYSVKLLDGFLTRSWIDYLSFGEIGSGGWTDGDGCINCVKSAWDLESESFRVSLLKHEAQHARDLAMDREMSSEELEYRAKLVELIYSSERNLLKAFAREADASDPTNGHAMAAHRIMKGFADALGVEKLDPDAIPLGQIQTVARELFDKRVSQKSWT